MGASFMATFEQQTHYDDEGTVFGVLWNGCYLIETEKRADLCMLPKLDLPRSEARIEGQALSACSLHGWERTRWLLEVPLK